MTTLVQRLRALASGEGQHSAYWRAVAMLTSGSTASQAVGIVAMLLLARIYAPAEFGSYAVFFSIAGMLSLISTAKYDYAVYNARQGSEASDITFLASAISIFAGALILAFAPFAPMLIASVTPRPILFVVLLATATASGGLLAALSALATQLHAFGVVTIGRLTQAVVTAGLSIGLGLMGWDSTGLMVGFAMGQVVATLYLAHRLKIGPALRRFSWRAAKARARRHASAPKFLLASEVINSLGANLFSFTTAPLFGPAVLGQYSLGFRLATMPMNLIGFSMGSIFRTAISPQHLPPQQIPALYISTAKRLGLIGLALTIPLLIGGPWLFRFVFGARWEPAGEYVQILAPLILIRFVAGPLAAISVRAGRAGLDTMIQLLFLASSAIAVGIGAWTHSFTATLVAFVVLQSSVYIFYLLLGYRLALTLAAQGGKQ